MELVYERILKPGADVVEWICSDTWPFHLKVRPSRSEVATWISAGSFAGDDVESFWVRLGSQRVGVIRLFDLSDLTPLFDLRVVSMHRGEGIGTAALRYATDHVFATRPTAMRFGGYTRFDNLAMRGVFEKLGFTHEARHREAWRTPSGEYVDSVGYAVVRREWEEGKSRFSQLRQLTPLFVDRR